MKKFFTLIILSMFSLSIAQARTSIIPNKLKNGREIHESPTAAAWSNRHVVGFDYEKVDSELEVDGTKTEETETSRMKPFVYWTFPVGVTAELEYSTGTEEVTPIPGTATETDLTEMQLNVGYKLPDMPLVLGFARTSDKTEGDTSTNEAMANQLWAGYKLNDSLYLGLGIIQGTTEVTGQADEDDDGFTIGVGYLKGEEKPDLAGEVTLTTNKNDAETESLTLVAQGLMNSGNTEYSGVVALVTFENSDVDLESQVTLLSFQVDHDFAPFYVAPSLTYTMSDSDLAGDKTEATDLNLKLEAGYRTATWAAYASYETGDETEDEMPSAGPDVENVTAENTLAVGFDYHF